MPPLSSIKKSNNQISTLTSGLINQLESDINSLDIVGVSVISFDGNGQVEHISLSAIKEIGFENQDIRGKKLTQFLHVYYEKQDVLSESLERLKKRENPIDLPDNSYIRLPRENKKFYIKGKFIGQYEEEKLIQIFFLFNNIEKELTREYILDMALSHTKIFPWYFDVDQNKMVIDARWFAHLGIPTQNCTLTAEEFAALVHPNDREGLIDALMQQIAGKLNKDLFTYRLHRKDGSWEWFEEQSAYLGAINGAPYRIVGVCQSIQDHKNVENDLILARNKAEESDRLKSAFLANMSHEIRTPLNAIVGFSNLLTSGEIPFDAEETQEYVRQINTNSDQLLRLISDILDLSKIESNSMEFHFSEQSLRLLLSDIYQAQILNMPPEIKFILELPKTDRTIQTDPMRLKQVVNNLINNAIKFTAEGNITFGYQLSEDKKQVQLFVKDTGIGIPQDKLQHIFKRFYKTDSFQKGTGLGLSICKSIVEHLHGSISAVSEPNKGSVFMVYLPLK